MARRRWNLDIVNQIMKGDQPFIQVGYTGKTIKHKEGDVWDDVKGVKWTISNGAKIRINPQADLIRELVKRKCSICGFDIGVLGNRLDEKVYSKTGKCLDCLQVEETFMECNGTYKDYTDKKMLKNKLSTAKEFRKNVLESINFLKKDDSKVEMVHSNGTITTFVGSQNEKLLKEAEEDLEKVDKLIIDLEKEVEQPI
jgi:hypothetical protein